MITRKEFNEGKFARQDAGKEHPIAIFLKKNRTNAYTVKEIADKTNYNINSARTALRKLVNKKKVKHRSPNYMWAK